MSVETNKITSKTQSKEGNAWVNGMWQLGLGRIGFLYLYSLVIASKSYQITNFEKYCSFQNVISFEYCF